MTSAVPPKGTGPLAKREARLAWGLLFPTIFSVAMVIILPLLSIFWISFKPVELADLRPPVPVVRESIKGKPAAPGDTATIEYRLSNRSQDAIIEGVTLLDEWPVGVTVTGDVPEACEQTGTTFYCDFGTIDPKYNERFQIEVEVGQAYFDWGGDPKDSEPVVTGELLVQEAPFVAHPVLVDLGIAPRLEAIDLTVLVVHRDGAAPGAAGTDRRGLRQEPGPALPARA